MTWNEFCKLQKDLDFPCPCCHEEFTTREAKAEHMQLAHMYEQLPLMQVEA